MRGIVMTLFWILGALDRFYVLKGMRMELGGLGYSLLIRLDTATIYTRILIWIVSFEFWTTKSKVSNKILPF